MTSLDNITLDALKPTLNGIGVSADSLIAWWRITAARGEGLLDFLVNQEVLTADVRKTLQMVQKGYLNLVGLELIRAGHSEAIQRKLKSTASINTPPPAFNKPPLELSPRPRSDPSFPELTVSRTKVSKVVPLSAASLNDNIPQLEIGGRVGRCLLTRLLGQGGGGVVYEAIHQGLGIPVAVKLLPPGMTSPSVLKALTQEARTLAMLQHPNVIRVLDFDPDAPTPYLVMELVSGLSLAELIVQSGWLRPDQAMNIVTQTAQGLEAGWRAGIVHRDVKPANILIERNGGVKVADLGLAAHINAAKKDSEANTEFKACGTVAYMAPERFESRNPPDIRSDIYSLGVTFYEALTGTLPFEGNNGFEFMIQHATAPIPDPRRINPLVPASISGLIERMMSKNPLDRFPSYDKLLEELQTYSLRATSTGQTTTRRHSWSMTQQPGELFEQQLAAK